jgi:PhnB protein
MTASWKPDGYPSLSPYLVVGDGRAAAVLDFLRDVFGGTPLRRFDRPDGTVMHAEMRVHDSVVMLADATDQWRAVPASLHVYVEDVDAVYARALAAGGDPLQEPSRKPDDPDRRGGFVDPAGNSWWIATQHG